MREKCAACGEELPADGSGCSCRRQARPDTSAWGSLDFDPARERQARAARAAAGSVVARLPSAPLSDPSELSGKLFEAPESPGLPLAPLAPKPAPRARAASRPLSQPLPESPRPRPDSAALRAGAPARAPSAPLHPALRGSKPQAQRQASGPLATHAQAAPSANADPQEHGASWAAFDGPFNDNAQLGPAVELATIKTVPLVVPAAAPGEAPAADPARNERIAALARFGPPPSSLLQTLPYCVRVARRRHTLRGQLEAHVRLRKQREQTAEQALCQLGESLFARASEPALAPLALQLRAVQASKQGMSGGHAAGQRNADARKREFAALSRNADERRALMVPVEQRLRVLSQDVLSSKARVRELEERVRAVDAEKKTLKSARDAQSLARLSELASVREADWGELQSLQVELAPRVEDQARLTAELTQHQAGLVELQEQQSRLMDVVERDEERSKVAKGDASDARRRTLIALAQAALRQNLVESASSVVVQAIAAQAPLAEVQKHEQLLAAAFASYDAKAYRRGLQLLVASALGLLVFCVWLALI